MKTRRAPSWHCREARVYGIETTGMYDMSTSPLPFGLFVAVIIWCGPLLAAYVKAAAGTTQRRRSVAHVAIGFLLPLSVRLPLTPHFIGEVRWVGHEARKA